MAKKTPETDDFKVKIDQAPQLTLNTSDKIYRALARRSADIYNFVYALVLNNENKPGGKPSYPLIPVTEISTFLDAKKADIYYHAAQSVMEYQRTVMKPFYDAVVDWCGDLMTRFNSEMGEKSR